MKPYPHHYTASARAGAIGSITICAPTLPHIETAPPPEFDGPGGMWSPEVLLCAAIADCFILSFRAAARAAHFNWIALDCRVEGVLERVENVTQFTRFATVARLTISQDGDAQKARLLLGRAEHACLVANSLRGERTLEIEVINVGAASAPADARALPADTPSGDAPSGDAPSDEALAADGIGVRTLSTKLETLAGQPS